MVPDALAQLVAAVAEDNPYAPPARIGELVVEELRRQGWHIGVPGSCRPVPEAVARLAPP
jgi:hypothetical protein